MRGVTAILVLMLAACSTAAGDTTTTAPIAEPSTTTTTVPSTTTTTERPTTTTVEECTERDGDGVLRNRRGFVCPPFMRAYERNEGSIEPIADIHLPGTYTLRLFTPAISFTRTERFRAFGENVEIVEYDSYDPYHRILSGAHDSLAAFPDTQPWTHPDHEWKTDVEIANTTVGGFPATVTRFTADCPDPDGGVDTPFCRFDLEGVPEWAQLDGQRTAVIVVGRPDGPFTIVAQSPDDFDTYWNEVAQPILDSIEFLDQ